MSDLGWKYSMDVGSREWKCGYCGREVAGNVGYKHMHADKCVLICPHCQNATSFIGDDDGISQYPPASYGKTINSLPSNIAALYGEICRCMQYSSFTGAVLLMRKMLVHLAVDDGAEEGTSFATCVNYLDKKGWIPPSGKQWVDKIRKIGNDATHHLTINNESEAKQLLHYIEHMLTSIYEFPASVKDEEYENR